LALPHLPARGEVLAMTPRERKIAHTLRMLTSDQQGEVFAAVQALKRLLQALGTDLDGLARGFEKILNGCSNGGSKAITQAEMQKAISDAYAAGIQDAENRLHGATDFQSTDGKPPWDAIALFLQRNKNRLDARHHDFIDDMASRTAFGREPTERQHKYLHSLFYKLGGKIT
jgi:hypothetical protein